MITAWVTEHALTRGVEELEVELDDEGNALVGDPGKVRKFIRAIHVHRTLNSAVVRAIAMREIKLRSLRRQIARLESLNFEELKP